MTFLGISNIKQHHYAMVEWSSGNINWVLPQRFHWVRWIKYPKNIFKIIQTSNCLCKRLGCYHNASKTKVTEIIFKLRPFHVSVIIQIPWMRWIHWIFFPFSLYKLYSIVWIFFLKIQLALLNEEAIFNETGFK